MYTTSQHTPVLPPTSHSATQQNLITKLKYTRVTECS